MLFLNLYFSTLIFYLLFFKNIDCFSFVCQAKPPAAITFLDVFDDREWDDATQDIFCDYQWQFLGSELDKFLTVSVNALHYLNGQTFIPKTIKPKNLINSTELIVKQKTFYFSNQDQEQEYFQTIPDPNYLRAIYLDEIKVSNGKYKEFAQQFISYFNQLRVFEMTNCDFTGNRQNGISVDNEWRIFNGKIRVVTIINCRVKDIGDDTFKLAANLTMLTLNNNLIDNFFQVDLATELPELWYLDLSYNLIKNMHLRAFRQFPNLRVLKLNNNHISKMLNFPKVNSGWFWGNLTELPIQNNTMECQRNQENNPDQDDAMCWIKEDQRFPVFFEDGECRSQDEQICSPDHDFEVEEECSVSFLDPSNICYQS